MKIDGKVNIGNLSNFFIFIVIIRNNLIGKEIILLSQTFSI